MFENAQEFAGWKFGQDVIWEKHNGSSFHADRFKRVHEHAVMFCRGEWAQVYKSPVFTNDATARTIRRKQKPTHLRRIEQGSYSSIDGGPRLMRSVIFARSCHGEAEHPTQKPVAIIDPLLRYSVPQGGSVLDPFMGSGTTAVACKALGISFTGVEIEERYCAVAVDRLRQGNLALGPEAA